MIEIERNTFFSRLYSPVCQKHTGYKELELHNCLGEAPVACTTIREEEVVLVLVRPLKMLTRIILILSHYTHRNLNCLIVRKGKVFRTEYTFLRDALIPCKKLSE